MQEFANRWPTSVCSKSRKLRPPVQSVLLCSLEPAIAAEGAIWVGLDSESSEGDAPTSDAGFPARHSDIRDFTAD